MVETRKQTLNTLSQASSFKLGESSEQHYNQWSENYDNELIDELGYLGPKIAAEAFAEMVEDKQAEIIDFGCGTGLVGIQLQRLEFTVIDGLDIAQGMLDKAKDKNIYRNLTQADLTQLLSIEDNFYDAGLCVGSMGAGHVEAEHLTEMLRVIKPEGVLIIFMNEGFYRDNRFDQRLAKHESEGRWHITKSQQINYMQSVERPGRLIVGRKSPQNYVRR